MILNKKYSKKQNYSKKCENKLKGGGESGTNDPMKAFNIIKKAGIDIANEINVKAIVKDLFTLLYDILTGGKKTEAEFKRRVLEQLYNFTGGNNCAIKQEICNNKELDKQIDLIYDKIYTTLENGVFSYATNAISLVPLYGPAAVAVINGLKIGYATKRDIVDKFRLALTKVNKIKEETSAAAAAAAAPAAAPVEVEIKRPPASIPKAGGTRKNKVPKKLTTKQIKHIAETYLQFLNLILYVKKKYKPNKNKKLTRKHKNKKSLINKL
jgi:pyruvate-formate lyase